MFVSWRYTVTNVPFCFVLHTVYFVNTRCQLRIPLYLDRKNDISFVCWYYELQPIHLRQGGYGNPLPSRSLPCCVNVCISEIFWVRSPKRFLWIEEPKVEPNIYSLEIVRTEIREADACLLHYLFIPRISTFRFFCALKLIGSWILCNLPTYSMRGRT